MSRFARTIVHPGPLPAERAVSVPCRIEKQKVVLSPGRSMNDAVAAALEETGFSSGYIRLRNARVNPLRYVIPAPSPDGAHAAWYSDTYAPDGTAVIEDAGMVVGRRDGASFFHCHGVWRTADGQRRMGHLLPLESQLAEPVEAEAWGASGARFDVQEDPETNFRLFMPVSSPDDTRSGMRGFICRVRPNEEIGEAIEALCRQHGIENAVVHGVGSVVGAVFEDAPEVPSFATEVLITQGEVRAGKCRLRIAIVDIDGVITEGTLSPGANPVCVTFELALHET
ncbi:PCC domain-containing protein [Mesorhizobium sp. Root1471]|nr:DUF296 domain-containing protein [Mesorhizobium sp. Root1471]